jgi:hypothetical protein
LLSLIFHFAAVNPPREMEYAPHWSADEKGCDMKRKLIKRSRFERVPILILLAVLAGSVAGGVVGMVTQNKPAAQMPTAASR